MPQDVGPDALYVLRGDVATAIQKGVSARSKGKVNGGAR